MSHTALARKYRPKRFAEVATQEHVSETLRRAIASDRVAHAYLFCGPRGIGKTTLARVLAMALNCPRRTSDGEPCGSCESCQRIWAGHTALDVVEIDAASNRGVDDARDLRERAMYAPSEEGRFKVYILDEAHMLTREAWNALLKILEEPPPRVIFIFATTEPQKIQQSASPILSRCQRFDFRRIGVGDITHRLQEVLEAEGHEAPEEALRTIARRADGGMRDAMSLLDQVLALTGGEISQEAVRRVLGLVEEERYLELLDIIRERRHGEVFSFVEALQEEGYDMVEFHRGLIDALRALLRINLSGDGEELGLREDLLDAYRARAGAFSPGDLIRMLAQSTDLDATGSLRRSAHPRLLLEMLVLRLSYLDRTVELEALLRGLGPEGLPGPETSPPSPMSSGRKAGSGDADGKGPVPSGSSASPGPGPAVPPQPRDESESLAPSPGPPPPEPSPGFTGPKPSGKAAIQEAWERVLEASGQLPRGVSVVLRGATVDFSHEGEVHLQVLPGPGFDRLVEPGTVKALKSTLAREVGFAPEIRIRERGGADHASVRITEDTVKKGRLQELIGEEPALREAVKELDLELLD
ncbi:MAG: DNA polymerase III subunit gamma/tau [Gemmatimonadota bacterium]